MTGQTLVFTIGAETVPPHMGGLTTGFINTLVMIGGVLFQPLVGFILDFMWDGKIEGGIPVYNLSDYKAALILIPACMLCAILTLLFIPETHPLSNRSRAPSLTKGNKALR